MSDAKNPLFVSIDIRSYWHVGTGRAGGADTDAIIDRDAVGLPVLRGRHIKGLLRDAANRLSADLSSEVWDEGRVNLLFGREARAAKAGVNEQLSAPCCLRFSDARLPDVVIAATAHGRARSSNADKVESISTDTFIRRLASTRIDFDTGAAIDKTLRSIEVAVPLKLVTRIEWDPAGREATKPLSADSGEEAEHEAIASLSGCWREAIAECLSLVTAVGAYRNRGFGRSVLTVETRDA